MFFQPANGVVIRYSGGDNVTTARGMQPRSLMLELACYDHGGIIPPVDTVTNDLYGRTRILINSRAACPMQCPLGGFGNRICASQGVCSYDWAASTARCFCNTGYSGPGCTSLGDAGLPTPPSAAPAVSGGVVGGMFLGAALVAAFVAFKAKRSGTRFVDALVIETLTGGTPSVRPSGGAPSSDFGKAVDLPAPNMADLYAAPDISAVYASEGDGALLA